MRGARHALFGLVALSCATEETALMGDGSGIPSAGGTASGSAGTGGGGAGPTGGASGSGMNTAGTQSTAGTFGFSGSNTVGGGGTFGMAGGSGGTMAGATTGGAGGSAGAGGKGGAGGASGAGGTSGSGGSGGSGGAGTVKCGDPAIPARAQWKASASAECAPTCADPNGPYTAALAIDGDVATRFASGQTQTGGEWLQIDLGAAAAVNRLTINTVPATDYTRHYQVRVSNTSGDMAAPVLAEGDGAAGTTNVTFGKAGSGRYVLITQTGTVAPATSWWSINEITVTCQ